MSWSGASNRHDIESCLRRMGGQDDAEIDVAEAALLLAALNRPQLGLERYRHHLSLLTRDIAELAGRQGAADSLEQRLAVLNAVLVERYGYRGRSEEHTSELQSLMRISYAVFCLKKKT